MWGFEEGTVGRDSWKTRKSYFRTGNASSPKYCFTCAPSQLLPPPCIVKLWFIHTLKVGKHDCELQIQPLNKTSRFSLFINYSFTFLETTSYPYLLVSFHEYRCPLPYALFLPLSITRASSILFSHVLTYTLVPCAQNPSLMTLPRWVTRISTDKKKKLEVIQACTHWSPETLLQPTSIPSSPGVGKIVDKSWE